MAAYSDEQYEKGGHEEVYGAIIYRETIRMQKNYIQTVILFRKYLDIYI